ncbi:SDR family NAD(P)-dependent oxidoreductase [Tardiphaga sp. OK245]|uniref:SDR family NAD(P)-dependent oxidoreductase n=1 Tax=Tardiphaga sp. OK245 TaxID=1855306 RepID=UPI0008A7A1D1|nr:SDR family NAD(P)-dependent oxidoreductase [Tardiphaga sp. OK245]SEI22141.1 NAD(P)-dependent dehydrogenase, short-chain alcohol dehydrogenase family [Tardiphaga sp. OK245]
MKTDKNVKWRRTDVSNLDLAGLKVAVIGGTGGIGRALSHKLASRGARVTVYGQTFRDVGVTGIDFVKADLSLMSEAKRVSREMPAGTLDLVIFTTGIMAGPKRQETQEGIERDMAVSYLSRLVILREIAARLGRDRPTGRMKPRVFVMGFPGTGQTGSSDDLNSDKSYSRWAAHMNTVAGNELLVLDSAKRFPGVTFFGLNPGFVKTSIRSNLFGSNSLLLRVMEWATQFMTASPETYADRLTPLFVTPDIEGHSGAMFNNKGDAILPTPKLLNTSYADAFLRASETLVSRATPA